MSDVASYRSRDLGGHNGALIGQDMGRVRGAVSRLGQSNQRLHEAMGVLESALDRLAGGHPKGAPIKGDPTVQPVRPDLDELDEVAQSIIDRCTHLDELVNRINAI